MTIALYGHPFSSYTMKVLIALYAGDTAFELRIVDPAHPENAAFVAANGGPLGKFPVLVADDKVLIESSAIIEYLALGRAGDQALLPDQRDAAIGVRVLDRVFDNYVMGPMQAIVEEHLRGLDQRDDSRCDAARALLDKSYRWLDNWLSDYPQSKRITLVECAAAPSLRYAELVHPIPAQLSRLRHWFAHLQTLPAVRRAFDGARPYLHLFPVPSPAPG